MLLMNFGVIWLVPGQQLDPALKVPCRIKINKCQHQIIKNNNNFNR